MKCTTGMHVLLFLISMFVDDSMCLLASSMTTSANAFFVTLVNRSFEIDLGTKL